MPMDAMVIVIIVGLFTIYLFSLVGIYIKLENRRELILSKFDEINNQIENKLDLIKELNDLIEVKKIKDTRLKILNSSCINEIIKYNKKLDDEIEKIETSSRKIKKVISELKKINVKIDYSKEFYNDSIKEYNKILKTPSGKILKKICKYIAYNKI